MVVTNLVPRAFSLLRGGSREKPLGRGWVITIIHDWSKTCHLTRYPAGVHSSEEHAKDAFGIISQAGT